MGLIGLVVGLVGCAASELDDAPEWDTTADTEAALAAPIDCLQASDHMPSERAERRLRFWAEDEQVREALGSALARLRAATGLELTLAPDGAAVVVTDLPDGVLGYASNHIDVDPEAVRSGVVLEPVVLHELGHMLGAPHLGPGEGVMSRCIGGGTYELTSADLMLICSAAPCTTFAPEIP